MPLIDGHCTRCGFTDLAESRAAADRRHSVCHAAWRDGPACPPLPSDEIVGQMRAAQFLFANGISHPTQRLRAARLISYANLRDLHYTGPQYEPDEPTTSQTSVILTRIGERAVAFALLRRQSSLWRYTWEQYDNHAPLPPLSSPEVRWSVEIIWVHERWRRRRIGKALLIIGASRLETPVDEFAWGAPLQPGAAALVRQLCPFGIWIS